MCFMRIGTTLWKSKMSFYSVWRRTKIDYIQTYLRTAETLVSAVKQLGSNRSSTQAAPLSMEIMKGAGRRKYEPQPASTNAQILLSTETTLLKAADEKRSVCIFRLGEIYGEGRSIARRVNQHARCYGTWQWGKLYQPHPS